MEPITLSPEQINAVNHRQAGAYAIKGIAGSGKTTVGLLRIPFLSKKTEHDNYQLTLKSRFYFDCSLFDKIYLCAYHQSQRRDMYERRNIFKSEVSYLSGVFQRRWQA